MRFSSKSQLMTMVMLNSTVIGNSGAHTLPDNAILKSSFNKINVATIKIIKFY